MITQFIVILYTLFFLFLLGALIINVFNRFTKNKVDLEQFATDYVILIGFIFIHIILGYTSIFSKIAGDVHVILFLLALTGLVFFRKSLSKYFSRRLSIRPSIRDLLFLPPILFVLIVFFNSLNGYNHYDSGLYYIQSIKWIESFPVVKGLGNLHGRFAFNSHFLIDQAFFDMAFMNFQYAEKPVIYYSLNAALFIVLLFRIIYEIRKSFQERNTLNMTIYIFMAYFSYKIISHLISNPSPDLISVILICYIAISSLNFKTASAKDSFSKYILVLSLVLVAITIKLSSLFLIIIPLLISIQFRRKGFISLVILGLIIITPFVVRNIFLSGYFVYPLPQIDLFSFDWEIPKSLVQSESDWIKSYAIDPTKFPNEVFQISMQDWIKPWYARQETIIKGLLILSGLSITILFFKGKGTYSLKYHKILIIGLFANTIYWFLTAPDPRFIWGVLIVSASLSCGFLLYYINLKKWKLVGLILLLLYFSFFETGDPIHKFKSAKRAYPIFPYQLPEFTYIKVNAVNFEISNPESGDQCFDAQLPCAPHYSNKNIRLLNTELKDGFGPKQ